MHRNPFWAVPSFITFYRVARLYEVCKYFSRDQRNTNWNGKNLATIMERHKQIIIRLFRPRQTYEARRARFQVEELTPSRSISNSTIKSIQFITLTCYRKCPAEIFDAPSKGEFNAGWRMHVHTLAPRFAQTSVLVRCKIYRQSKLRKAT